MDFASYLASFVRRPPSSIELITTTENKTETLRNPPKDIFMPHSTEEMNGTPLTNGERPHSKVLSHLQSYPAVKDSVEFYKSNPYGAKSIDVANNVYQSFVTPIQGYLQTPYSLISPYLHRADELGDAGLSKVEEKFPIVKEDSSKIKETVTSFTPVRLAGQGSQYVLDTFNGEYNQVEGNPGLVRLAKAAIRTGWKTTFDGVGLVRQYLAQGRQQGEQTGHAAQQHVQKTVNEVKN